MSRRQPTNEKLLQPRTAEKYGITRRIMFRRRDRMRDRNLVLIYYDGVIGDTSFGQGYNNFRL